MPNLAGKVVIVTGSTKGIGLAIAERMHAAGATVVVSSRSAGDVASVAKRLGSPTIGIPCDVGDAAACQRLVDETVKRLFPMIAKERCLGYSKAADLVQPLRRFLGAGS